MLGIRVVSVLETRQVDGVRVRQRGAVDAKGSESGQLSGRREHVEGVVARCRHSACSKMSGGQRGIRRHVVRMRRRARREQGIGGIGGRRDRRAGSSRKISDRVRHCEVGWVVSVWVYGKGVCVRVGGYRRTMKGGDLGGKGALLIALSSMKFPAR